MRVLVRMREGEGEGREEGMKEEGGRRNKERGEVRKGDEQSRT